MKTMLTFSLLDLLFFFFVVGFRAAGKRKSVSNNGGEPGNRLGEGLKSKVGSSVAGRGPLCLPNCNAERSANRERRVIHQKQFESKIRNASSEGCSLN
jgi:hypothetical protein